MEVKVEVKMEVKMDDTIANSKSIIIFFDFYITNITSLDNQ